MGRGAGRAAAERAARARAALAFFAARAARFRAWAELPELAYATPEPETVASAGAVRAGAKVAAAAANETPRALRRDCCTVVKTAGLSAEHPSARAHKRAIFIDELAAGSERGVPK